MLGKGKFYPKKFKGFVKSVQNPTKIKTQQKSVFNRGGLTGNTAKKMSDMRWTLYLFNAFNSGPVDV